MSVSYSHQVAQGPRPAPRPGLQWETQNSAWITRPFIAPRPVVLTLVIHRIVTQLSVMTKLSHVCLLMLTFLMWVQADVTFSFLFFLLHLKCKCPFSSPFFFPANDD